MSRKKLLATTLGATAIGLGLALVTPSAPVTANTTAPDDDPGRLILVLDSSGSMKEAAGGGETRIQAAKKALRQVINVLPDDQEVGLRVFGAEVFSRNDTGACTDSQLVVEPGTGNRDQLTDAVNSYAPYGETPTGFALQEAGKDLGSEGDRTIVLVSDGEPTCDPDPCEVAAQLHQDGINLRIDVVGLDVDGKARDMLQCVATKGGGNYYDARSSQELVDTLTRVSERTARAHQSIGSPVTGTDAKSSAPTISAGDWVDATDPAVGDRHYKVERQFEASTLVVSATFRTPPGGSFNIVRLETADGSICSSNGTSEHLAIGRLVGTGTAAGPISEGADDPCATDEELYAVVDYTGDEAGIPVELRVTEIPAVTDVDALDEPVREAPFTAPDGGSRSEVTGGTSFGDAEPLTAGGYSGEVVPGETLTFSVDADWGQQVATALSIDAARGQFEAVAGQYAVIEIYSPARTVASTATTEPFTQPRALWTTRSDLAIETTTPPINLANLTSIEFNGAALAGQHTITVYLEPVEGAPSLPVPFRLDVGVTGEATAAPTFDERPIDRGTPDDDPTEEPTASDGPTSEPDEETSTAPEDDGGLSTGQAVAGGLGLAALLGAGALFLRRRTHPATGDAD